MTDRYIGGPPDMDTYADVINAPFMPTPTRVALKRPRRVRSWWGDMFESAVVRGLAVGFVLVSGIAIGLLIARVMS